MGGSGDENIFYIDSGPAYFCNLPIMFFMMYNVYGESFYVKGANDGGINGGRKAHGKSSRNYWNKN
jgi:hypothetical protein